jgi:hypothetical protein
MMRSRTVNMVATTFLEIGLFDLAEGVMTDPGVGFSGDVGLIEGTGVCGFVCTA